MILSLLPLSPLLLLGISDSIIYRRILGQVHCCCCACPLLLIAHRRVTVQGNGTTGGLISVLREMVSKEGGGVLSLLNYGLLTAVQVVPGFLSFLAMRLASRLLFGTSLQRKHQISRRKEIVDSHLSTIGKKSTATAAATSSLGGGGGGLTLENPASVAVNGKGISRNRSAHFGI